MPADDIPIQVMKDETSGEGKSNLVSITEEQESTEAAATRSSMRQSKDQKTASKITNFPVLGKKPKEKEGKVLKNAHVTQIEKEKKLGSQTASRENIKGSLSMLNNDSTEIDGNVNGCAIRKKNNSMENNAIIIDPNVALIDGERLTSLNDDINDGGNIESSINLKAHNETESMSSSIQVSSV